MRKTVSIIFLFLVLLFFAFQPIDISLENSVKVEGIVKNITEAGAKDILFELENDKTTYYINRGFEKGIILSKKEYIGKKVTLYYAKNWTPLAPLGTTSKHLTQLQLKDKIVYSEFK
ncbi:hypothetical protein J2X31_002282 [Flavobacterium arsenatis]|uniref:DUF3221 domain-containing protein n=1 Tax=Flavobacterium arsenatis TaxID=1484332 RepID=A0ABU1TQK8_9FLAO|nr:hypothetical protein [Flavobacterium arsenatis]MDR6968265.1 hypothetical protein [Flavobacterium arsenatis]